MALDAELRWSDSELLNAFIDTVHDADLLRSEIRRRSISWQTLAEAGVESTAVVALISERGYKISLAEARKQVKAHVDSERQKTIRRLISAMRQVAQTPA